MTDATTPISIVGAGALGHAIALGLHAAGRPIVSIVSRSRDRGGPLAERVGARFASQAEHAGATLLCVPDDCIEIVAASLDPAADDIVAHCAGSRGLEVLQAVARCGASVGSMHPLMVLAHAGRGPEALVGATAAIEGDERSTPWLRALAVDLGMRPVEIPPEKRALYHLSASLVGGLMTGLLAAAADLWPILGFDRTEAAAALGPMVREAGRNLETLGVPGVVMGPAARGDVGTIRKHLAALDSHAAHLRPLYLELVRLSLPYAIQSGQLNSEQAEAMHALLRESAPE